MPVRQSPPLRIFKGETLFFSAQLHLPIKLIENSMRRFRQHRRNQNRDDAQRFGEMIKDGIELSTALFLFCKLPWRSSLNKNVTSRRSLDRNVQRGINRKLVHLSIKPTKSIVDRCCVIQKGKIFWLFR